MVTRAENIEEIAQSFISNEAVEAFILVVNFIKKMFLLKSHIISYNCLLDTNKYYNKTTTFRSSDSANVLILETSYIPTE